MRGEPFAVTSLAARFGLSEATAFFFAGEVVLCEFGVTAALGAQVRYDADVTAWCEAARAKATRVMVLPDPEISNVRLRFCMMQHELWVAHETGGVQHHGYRRVRRAAPRVHRYALLQREEAERAARLLGERFGPRFELATTRAYAFIHRVSPLLTR